MFIPATIEEVRTLGWENLDVILVSGDAYLDSPHSGIAVIGHVLIDAGYRVALIPQPDIGSSADINRFGEPLLFWGISSGSVDSMVSNYNADRSRRRQDDFTPGGENTRRPDRALIAYTGLIRRYFKETVPIVLGGIEASLRRVAHYDYWQNKIRRSILFDAKADLLVFGMGEETILKLASAFTQKEPWHELPGIARISRELPEGAGDLPSYEETLTSPDAFEEMYRRFYRESLSTGGSQLTQKTGDRYLVINPPPGLMHEDELDRIYGLPYERRMHPLYDSQEKVRAVDTVQFSVTTHRGCCGECNFCAIAVHQGRQVISRSEDSILKEVKEIARHRDFKGIISDVGGPTANMYGLTCPQMQKGKTCSDRRCLFPEMCTSLKTGHDRQVRLLQAIRKIEGVKKVFVASGIRYDMVTGDREHGLSYLNEIAAHHVSGQLRVAPEHASENVLSMMGKPGGESLSVFTEKFNRINEKLGKKQYLSYYYIAAHPGCSHDDMDALVQNHGGRISHLDGSVQIFTPTPSTWSTLMYYTGKDPFSGRKIFVERDMGKKKKQQKSVVKEVKKGAQRYSRRRGK